MRKITYYKLVTASSAIDLTEKVNQAIQEEGLQPFGDTSVHGQNMSCFTQVMVKYEDKCQCKN